MMFFRNTKDVVLDTLFPINCYGCGCYDFWFCADCLKRIELLSFQKCPRCENIITESGAVCRKCKSDSPLSALLIATRYACVSKMIHLYKYKFIDDLHLPLGNLLVDAMLLSKLPLPDMIIPVPLHPRRLRWRGFNQSQLLATYLAKNLISNFEIETEGDVLQRSRYTYPQMKIGKYQERLDNLSDAFCVTKPDLIQNKTILLVDDIATTGATLFECAKTLKNHGVKKVLAIAIARQEMGMQ